MKNKEINFTRENFIGFINDNRMYSYLMNNLTKAFFKVEPNQLTFFLKGNNGIFKQTFNIEYDGEEIVFAIEYSKWINALNKFDYADSIQLNLTKSFLKISNEKSSDTINLGISVINKDTVDNDLNSILSRKNGIVNNNLVLNLSDEIMADLNLAGSLFVAQGRVNSIGLGKNGIIYADRSTILRTIFTNNLPDYLFNNLDEDEEYIFIHQYLVSLFPFLYKESPSIYFSTDYSAIYWAAEDKELIYNTENRELAIPSEDQLEDFIPGDKDSYFELDLNTFKTALDFFNGFYEGSVWKPITFNCSAGKEVVMRYKHSTADITKTLPCVCPADGEFILESEALKKVVNKVRNKENEEMTISINYDESAPGVLCNISNYYKVIFAKLEDDSDI